MTFKPALWRPIAFVLSVINVVAVGFAAGEAEPYHAAAHAALALAFGLWAQRLGQARRRSDGQTGIDLLEGDGQARLEVLEADVSDLRRELSETQERLDFAERMLAQGAESRRLGPDR